MPLLDLTCLHTMQEHNIVDGLDIALFIQNNLEGINRLDHVLGSELR